MKFAFLLTLFGWLSGIAYSQGPITLGHADTLYSDVLHEQRVLNIYLPADYSADSTYPVIYLLDGALNEDFIHIAGLVQFCTFPWVNYLKPSILVGIANTDRKRDMTYTSSDFDWPEDLIGYKPVSTIGGGSGKFMDFIEKELQPYINQHYRSNGQSTVIGQSLAGLAAAEMLLKRPQLFDNYIITSPSLWWGNEALLVQAPELLKNLPSTPVNIYLAVGKEGKTMEGDAKKLAAAIKKVKKPNVTFTFDYLPTKDHGTILHQAVSNGFEVMSATDKK